MHWILVVIVAGSPMKTDLTFDTLDACLTKETAVRKEWVEVVNKTVTWANKNLTSEDEKKQSINYVMSQTVHGTCIPAK